MKRIIRLALCCAALASLVTQSHAQVTANFTANPTNGLAPLTVYFTNLSTGATDYIWDFGNGNTSTNANPANIYLNAGAYTVTLTAVGPGGTNTLSIPNYVGVPPHAIFIALNGIASGAAPLTIAFTNLSTGGATNYLWDFGDTNTSTVFSPTHTYTSAGVYTVSLTAFGPGGSNAYTAPNYITVTNPLPPSATTSFHTNIVFNVSISLDAVVQVTTPVQTNFAILTANPIKGTTKDVINFINADLGRTTNHTQSKLLWRIGDVGTPNETFSFILRDGTNDTDITSRLFFQSSTLDYDRSATTLRTNPKSATTNSTDYFIERLTLRTAHTFFDGLGVFLLRSSSLVNKGQVISSSPVPMAFRMAFAGAGAVSDQPAVIRGQITAAGRKIEIQQTTSP